MTWPLHALAPALAAWVPREVVGTAPSPLETHPAAAAAWGCAALHVKREDRFRPGIAGNKARALELLLPAIRAGGRFCALGPAGSNWARALVVAAGADAARVRLDLFRRPQNPDGLAGLAAVAGRAEAVREHGGAVRAAWRVAWARWREGRRALPAGGTSGVAVLAHVNAALETAAQWPPGAPRPARCYVAHGTGGTAVGLALGFALLDWPTTVIGVRVADRLVSNRWLDAWWAAGAARHLRAAGLRVPGLGRERLRVDGRAFGGGYGVPGAAGVAAALEVGSRLGLPCDPTYTAKTAAALLADARAGLLRDLPVLLWHTWGPPEPSA